MNKQEVVDRIKDYVIPHKELKDVDDRLDVYITEVLEHPNDHNKYEILSVFRFLDFWKKYEFRPKEIQAFSKFYEFLKFPSKDGLKAFPLTPIQYFQYSNIFGFYKEDGVRLCREALLFIPRKFSKALSIFTEIPTPDGYKQMWQIKVGDYVLDENGEPVKVIEATEIRYNHKCYELRFDDGDRITCDEDHLWKIKRHKQWMVVTADKISRLQVKKYKTFVPNCGKIYNDGVEKKRILEIVEVPSVPVKCIAVDSPTHLYCCGRQGTVTHNTTSVASLAIYDLLFGENDAQSYVAANSFYQAQLCFNIIKETVKTFDPGFKNFQSNKDIIYSKIPNRTSMIRCLSNSADKLDGLNASTVIIDEYSQAEFGKAEAQSVKNVLVSSMGIRKEPLVITITTASHKLDTPFTVMLDINKKILEGEIENDTIFSSIFEPDEGDDISDPHTWHKVQPHLGITVLEQSYEEYYKKALTNAEDMAEFKTKYLNMFCVPPKKEWVSPTFVKKSIKHLDFNDLQSRPNAMVSVDLSVRDDFSCVCYCLYDSVKKKFFFKNDYYLPAETLKTHKNKQLYQKLVEDGHLKICGQDIIDYHMICDDIIANSKYINILQIGYDSNRSADFIAMMKAYGFASKLQVFIQTNYYFTKPIESFEIALYQGKLVIDDNPLNEFCIHNSVVEIDRMNNMKIFKKSEHSKIDGAVCMLMCLGLFMNYKR